MVKVPSRASLAKAIENLERDLKVATAGGIVGGTLARSATARGVALRAGRSLSPYALAVDALIRAEGVEARSRREGLPLLGRPAVAPKKKPKSKFNKAVSAGMKILKSSTSYGAKGKINNAKKAFSVVTKTASAVNKGKKLPKSGIRRKLAITMRKIL